MTYFSGIKIPCSTIPKLLVGGCVTFRKDTRQECKYGNNHIELQYQTNNKNHPHHFKLYDPALPWKTLSPPQKKAHHIKNITICAFHVWSTARQVINLSLAMLTSMPWRCSRSRRIRLLHVSHAFFKTTTVLWLGSSSYFENKTVWLCKKRQLRPVPQLQLHLYSLRSDLKSPGSHELFDGWASFMMLWL